MLQRLNLYAEPKFRRLGFDSYILRRKARDSIVAELCGDGRTLVFLW